VPRGQVDVELAPSLSLIRGARHIHIKLVGACLLRHALRSPQEILQAAKSRVVANEDVQAGGAQFVAADDALSRTLVANGAQSTAT
jgi:hypothetical protein